MLEKPGYMLSCRGKSWNLYGILWYNPGIYGKVPWKILESPRISVSNLAGHPVLSSF